MNEREAHRILHPATSREALWAYEYYGGFSGREAGIKAVDDACLVACEALEKQIPKKPIDKIRYPNAVYGKCPTCEKKVVNMPFCQKCGQKLDWSDEDEQTNRR